VARRANDDQMQPRQPPPVIYVQQPKSRATAVGVWVLVLWFVGPAVLIALCCLGCFFAGGIGGVLNDQTEPSPTVSVTP
jgi:hypothetical protein